MAKKPKPGTEAWLLEECKKLLESYRVTHRVFYKKIDLHYQKPGFPDLLVSFAPKGQAGQPIVALIELKTLHPRSSLGKGQAETIRAMREQGGMHAYVCWGLAQFKEMCIYLSQGGLPYDKPIEKPKGQGGKTLWDL